MVRRFFVEPERLAEGIVPLLEEEARHASVLRLRVGDAVEVLAGDGRVGHGTVCDCGRDRVAVRIETVETVPQACPHVTVATAIPKGKRYQTMVEKLTELGVSVIQPVLFERSVVEGKGDLERVRRWSREACKQSRRAWFPEIREAIEYPALLAGTKEILLLADPAGNAVSRYGKDLQSRGIILMVGPEGGVTGEERDAALTAGAKPIALGPHIMRIETAAMAGCAILMMGGDD